MSQLSSEFFTPKYSGEKLPEPSPVSEALLLSNDPADDARMLTKVYVDLGVLNDEGAEKAPEELTPQLTQLYENHVFELEVVPFITVNISDKFGFKSLVNQFDYFKDTANDGSIIESSWEQIDPEVLNRRVIGDPKKEPAAFSIRGHILTDPENCYEERGLMLTDKNSVEQRHAAAVNGLVVVNPTDYIGVQAVLRELGRPLLDSENATYTKFIAQLTNGVFGGKKDKALDACASPPVALMFQESSFSAYEEVGIRTSVGLE